MTPDAFRARLEEAAEAEDLDALEALAAEFADGGQPPYPFQPDLRLRGTDPAEEGEVGIGLANAWSRTVRQIRFNRRLRQGYAGPVLVSEGDSWFQYPLRLHDVIDNLSEPFAIRSLGAAGATLAQMRQQAEYRDAIAETGAAALLFSASGNDALGGGQVETLLQPFAPGMEAPDILNDAAVEAALAGIEAGFDAILRDALSLRAGLVVLFHGYDRPRPRPGGRWLGGPMERLGIPRALQAEVAGLLIDRLNARLGLFESRFPGRAVLVDCRGRVGDSPQSWYDEIHPRDPGYARVADLFEHQIREALAGAPSAPVPVGGPVPGGTTRTEEAVLSAVPATGGALALSRHPTPAEQALHAEPAPHLSAEDRRILAEYRALLHEGAPEEGARLAARRHMVPDDDETAFERILGESNLFPINFLSRGAAKARAVAKIQLFLRGDIPHGSGSGFMVAPGLMLTNNHVLDSRETARRARAVFDYQDDDDFQQMPAKTFAITGDVFFTSDRHDMDFTLVSVAPLNDAGDRLAEYGHFTLIEESGKAIQGEPVSIVQHPGGRPKSIALRDSRIVGVAGDFIYYSTDTERGSSGSPVLNDQWLPVALHHRSVPHPSRPGEWIANRGVRISRIFARLRDAGAADDRDAAEALRLILGNAPPEPVVPPVEPEPRPLRRRETAFLPLPPERPLPHTEERFTPDRWAGVAGYEPDFLTRRIALPLPEDGSVIRAVDERPDLPYTHFSVVMHADRRLPLLTACNIDGARLRRLPRSGSWRLDPRLPDDAQIGNEAYVNNAYDRGHLVRRVAPMWGTVEDARTAMADTFHYTVCAPQHARLNQRPWLELEDYILDWAEGQGARVSIFTGPVFRPDDPVYRGIVRIPADYWKIAVAEDASGLRAVGYLHSQKNLIPTVEEAFGSYKTHRVPIHVLSELAGIDFAALQPLDVAAGPFEAFDAIRLVSGPEDIGL